METLLILFLKTLSVLWTIMMVGFFLKPLLLKTEYVIKIRVNDMIYFAVYVVSIYSWFIKKTSNDYTNTNNNPAKVVCCHNDRYDSYRFMLGVFLPSKV